MKLPELQETKFNKRAGKETPVLRVYKTKRGGVMYFAAQAGVYRYFASPYFFWSTCSFYPTKGRGFAALRNFQARICGIGE